MENINLTFTVTVEQVMMFIFVNTALVGFFCYMFVNLLIKRNNPTDVPKKKFLDRFRAPTDGTFQLNWGLREFFKIFSKDMSERWYECRTHCNQGILVSLLSAFHLVWVVRGEFFIEGEDDRIGYVYSYIHGFQSVNTVFKKYKKYLDNDPEFDKIYKERNFNGVYQVFIAGHNVVADFMSGYLQIED